MDSYTQSIGEECLGLAYALVQKPIDVNQKQRGK